MILQSIDARCARHTNTRKEMRFILHEINSFASASEQSTTTSSVCERAIKNIKLWLFLRIERIKREFLEICFIYKYWQLCKWRCIPEVLARLSKVSSLFFFAINGNGKSQLWCWLQSQRLKGINIGFCERCDLENENDMF